jgi:hypothetical protein
MGGNSLVALQVQTPDVMGAYNNGVDTAQRQQSNSLRIQGQQQDLAQGVDKAKMDSAERVMQMIGAGSMYAMGGNLNGQPDPAKFEEVLDGLTQMGVPKEEIDKFRGKPQLAPIAARASMSALQQLQMAQSDRDYDLALKKFEADLQGGTDAPSGYQKTPTGLEPIPGGPADPENPLNRKRTNSNGITIGPDGTVQIGGNLSEGQAKTAGYTERMVNAETELASPATPDGKSVSEASDPTVASGNPLSGDFWTMLNRKYGPNMTQSPEYQRFYNGAQEWVRAKLRKESGAAISPQEWSSEFQTYFPQPGDSTEVVQQKARLRVNAVDAMKGESRGGYGALFGKQQDGQGDTPADQPAGSKTINGKTYVQDANGDWYEQ